MTDAKGLIVDTCGRPTMNGPCEKPYCHVSPYCWAEPVFDERESNG